MSSQQQKQNIHNTLDQDVYISSFIPPSRLSIRKPPEIHIPDTLSAFLISSDSCDSPDINISKVAGKQRILSSDEETEDLDFVALGNEQSNSSNSNNIQQHQYKYQENTSSSSYQGLQSLGDESRISRYLNQFNTENHSQPSQKPTRKSYSKSRFKSKRSFKSKRKKSMRLNDDHLNNRQSNDPVNSRIQKSYNHYNDDPGLNPSDFSMQWEGIRGVILD